MLSSDGEGEFGEGLRDPVLRVDIKAKFVMAVVEVLDEGCPALITRTERSRLRPRIGRSRDC